MGIFGFGKKKEKDQTKPIETHAPVSVTENDIRKQPAPPQTVDGFCPVCQKPIGSSPIDLSDTIICRPCSLLLRDSFFFEPSSSVTSDPLSKMSFKTAKEIIDIPRQMINDDLADYADKYSFIADVFDVEDFGSGCALATVLIAKGGNPKGCRATIIRNEETVGFALIENAVPCTGYDFNTSYAQNAVKPDEWNEEAYAWLILGIDPSQLTDDDIIVLD